MDGVIGIITCFAGNFIPKNWLACNGQSLPIATNKPLFSIIGNTFGGDGVTNFNLPDLRGRTPVSPGQSSGTNYKQGQTAGAETVTITDNQVPAHTHSGAVTAFMQGNTADGIDPSPNKGWPSRFTGAYATTANCNMAKPPNNLVCGPAGTTPVNILSPYLVVTYIICVSGIFPSRN